MAEAEVEYESDPEEAKLSLKMRRREASDDEEEGERWGDRREKPPRRIDDSEGESEGGAAEYEDETGEEEEEEYYVDEECVEEGDLQCGESVGVEAAAVGVKNTKGIAAGGVARGNTGVSEDFGDGDLENNVDGVLPEEQKKEIEPSAVPTAGAFYMHDDRFRDNARGRNRRMLGGRKLWESKEERKWGHDKFEELTVQERHHGERRRGSRGRYRGRGRNQGADHLYPQVNRQKEIAGYSAPNKNNQSNASKGSRGRGTKKYQSSFKNYDEPPMPQKKFSEKSVENSSHINSGRASGHASNAEPERTQPRRQVASNLSVTSPPFYPTSSSTKDYSMPTRRDGLSAPINGSHQHSISDKDYALGQSNGVMRGKNVVDSIDVDKLYIEDPASRVARRSPSSMELHYSASLATNASQPQLRSQGKDLNFHMQMAYQPVVSGNQVNRAPSSGHLQSASRNPSLFRSQTHLQASAQQYARSLPSGAEDSSPPKSVGTMNTLEQEEHDSKVALVAKVKESMQGSAQGSFIYGGAQAVGAAGGFGRGNTDQNFPTFLPVMQFGGQHPGGIGVPAVGMAFPGYVAQPQLGIGSSEMTWLPVLAGAAGSLGATYCSPYIAVDGSYNSRSASSVSQSSSNQHNGGKVSDDWKAAQKDEHLTAEVGQRQKNPRRYTEMKFDQ